MHKIHLPCKYIAVSSMDIRCCLCLSYPDTHNDFGEKRFSSGVPVTGCYKSQLALSVCLPVMFRYIPL